MVVIAAWYGVYPAETMVRRRGPRMCVSKESGYGDVAVGKGGNEVVKKRRMRLEFRMLL